MWVMWGPSHCTVMGPPQIGRLPDYVIFSLGKLASLALPFLGRVAPSTGGPNSVCVCVSINQYQHNDAPTIKSRRPPLYQVFVPFGQSYTSAHTRARRLYGKPNPSKMTPQQNTRKKYHTNRKSQEYKKRQNPSYPLYPSVNSNESNILWLAMSQHHINSNCNPYPVANHQSSGEICPIGHCLTSPAK